MREDKTEVIEQFKETPSIRVLLSSEVASEGVDLQFCRFLINYDLPWNPMKVEQRIGRIDRLGQAAEKIIILNFVYAGTIDARIVQRLYERLNLFERALGGLEAVLGDEIQQLTAELLTGRLTPQEEEQRISQTALALEKRNQSEQELEEQAGQLIAHSDYILKKVHAAREFSRQITVDDLLLYVRDYLEKSAPGHRWFQPGDDLYEVELSLPPATRAKLDSFIASKRLQGLSRLAEGGVRRCRFENKVKSGSKVPSIHVSSVAAPPGTYAFAVQRWTFDGLRTEEAVRARAVDLVGQVPLSPEASIEVVNAARVFGRDWPGASGELDASKAANALMEMEFLLIEDFDAEGTRKESENTDRIQFQLQAVKAYRDRKVATERQRIMNLGNEPRNRGLVIASERAIDRLTERFELQSAKLEQASTVRSKREPVGKGIIFVEGNL
jgi:hypothetical protein